MIRVVNVLPIRKDCVWAKCFFIVRSSAKLMNDQTSKMNANASVGPNWLHRELVTSLLLVLFLLLTGCSGGRFGLWVFRWPKMNIDNLAFVPLLLEHDTTGVPFQKTRQVEGMKANAFGIKVNDAGDGLATW